MTDKQESEIRRLRTEGYGYDDVAKILGLSKDKVRYYCRMHGLDGVKAKERNRITKEGKFCAECGKFFMNAEGKKNRRFCCDKCRISYWNSHRLERHKKGRLQVSVICRGCGKTFFAYKGDNRIFCSTKCYMDYRFRGANSNG